MLRIRRESEKRENHRVTAPAHPQKMEARWRHELESNLRLEKVVTSKQLRLAMETEDERARQENDAATKRLS